MEIYWDQAFLALAAPVPLGEIGARPRDGTAWTVSLGLGEASIASRQPPAASLFIHVLTPREAELRFHGFPREKSPDGRKPRIYDYEDAAQSEVMKPLPGRYTRYGDVAGLIAGADDRLAILAPGDEVALSFNSAGLPALEAGWKRSWFLAAVGYCKDADLYTATGDRLDPLPFRSMSAYPPPPAETPRGGPPRVEENDRVVAPLLFGTGPESPVIARRLEDYRRAKSKARSWFDGLEVDAQELQRHGVKGKKKLAEILDAYLSFHRHAGASERAAIAARVEKLAAQTRRPEYHNLRSCSETELTQNSMSYLRVAWLLEKFGMDWSGYRREMLAAKERLDAHVIKRGPWQQAMFGEYYDRFKLDRPAGLAREPLRAGIISRRVAAEAYTEDDVYDLTHEVFVAYDYGIERKQDRFSKDDLAYTRVVLPALAARSIERKNPDLLGEILSCMTYLGWQADPSYSRSIEYLLDHQNSDGTWGSYEAYRKQFGRYLEQQVYLHTTMVVLDALVEAFEGNWEPHG